MHESYMAHAGTHMSQTNYVTVTTIVVTELIEYQ